jgi:hypothetical protein
MLFSHHLRAKIRKNNFHIQEPVLKTELSLSHCRFQPLDSVNENELMRASQILSKRTTQCLRGTLGTACDCPPSQPAFMHLAGGASLQKRRTRVKEHRNLYCSPFLFRFPRSEISIKTNWTETSAWGLFNFILRPAQTFRVCPSAEAD